MNGEYEFRGQRIDNGEWVYGFLYQLPLPAGVGCMILTTDNTHEDNSIEPKYHLAFTLWVDLFPVKPDTVGQFTGLVDKNGVKIFEGDILYVTVFDCFDNDKQYRVRVEWAGTEFMGVDVTNDDSAWNLYWLCNQDEEIEVIGNIHDNTELLAAK